MIRNLTHPPPNCTLAKNQRPSSILQASKPHALMPTLDYPHITRAPNDVARLDRLPRIRVAQIAADHIGNGWSAEEIIRQYPHLTAAEVHAALGYYFDHREEVESELAAEVTVLDADNLETSSALRLRLLALRRGASA